MSSPQLRAAAQEIVGDETVLAAGIFTIPDSIASLTKGSLAAAIAIPDSVNPVLSGAGNVAALEMARAKEAESKGLTERMVVAVTESSIHLLALPHVGKTPERELFRLERDAFDVKISKLGLSRKLQLTHRESGEKLKLMGYTVGPTDVAKGDKAVLEALA
ncbi:MAG TPA: hypothetical protein VFB52_14225 [Solirubrobacterales bacterium]|nr:hypothetical protein [Solirubrobacterales bacterium]